MKIAVLYSGNIRQWPVENHQKIWEDLDVDLYYGVWKDDEYEHYLPSSFEPIILERPKYLGHPLRSPTPWGGCYNEKNVLFMKHIHRSIVSPEFYEWYKYGHYQVYAHALLCDAIGNHDEYDLIIKTRYDVHFKFEIKGLIQRVLERTKEYNLVNTFCNKLSNEYDVIEKSQARPEVEPSSVNMTNVYSKTGYMCDHVIFYTPGMFSSKLVYDLYNERKLLPCELGWGQAFCDRSHDTYKKTKKDLPVMFREYYEYSHIIDTIARKERRKILLKELKEYEWIEDLFKKSFPLDPEANETLKKFLEK